MKKLVIVSSVLSLFATSAFSGDLPKDCSGKDGVTAKIFTDKNLKKPKADLDSDGFNFVPNKSLTVDGKTIYQGSAYFSRNGEEQKGSYFINATEWNCK